jgi:hypothetical protein
MAIISLSSINQMVFVMVKGCFLFELWTETLNIIHARFDFKGLKRDL